jgi:predicted Zn-dependent protease
MFVSDVAGSYKEELHSVIIHELRHIGVKHRIKKSPNKHSLVRCQLYTLGSAIALNFDSGINFCKF